MITINFKEKFKTLNNEQIVKLITIFCNNPFLNFDSAISLIIQKNKISENEIVCDKDKYLIEYSKTENRIAFLNKVSDKNEYNAIEFVKVLKNDNRFILDFNKFKEIFYAKTKIKVYINTEVDFYKKDHFIYDNVLWITNFVKDDKKANYIILEYASLILEKYNSMGVNTLVYLMLDYIYNNKVIKLPKIIEISDTDKKYDIIDKSIDCIKEILYIFYKKFLPLNTLINTINNVSYDNITDQKLVLKIKSDFLAGNKPADYPYYFY